MPNQPNHIELWNDFATFDNFLLAWQRLANVTSRMVTEALGTQIFAFNLHENIQDLVERVDSVDEPYRPLLDNKVYVPKPSTTMRTMSMMCVPDLVIYQAMANTIADASHHFLVTHENQHVWGNLYSGEDSRWMLKPWKYQYDNFVDEIVKIHKDGNTWIASTDIVSFYDTIDHQTLLHLVKKYCGDDKRFLDFLEKCLHTWAAHNTDSSMSRGIPQGSNASDFLANLYLYEIDRHMIVKGYQYVRYVDDIRILGKNKATVQRGLIDFDLELKKHGLVAQVTKTSVHHIEYIEHEISRLKFWVTDPADSTTYKEETSLPQSEQASSVRDFVTGSQSDAVDQTFDDNDDADPDGEPPSPVRPTVDDSTSAESVQNQLYEQFLDAFEHLDDIEKGKEADTKITYCLNRLFKRDDIREKVLLLLDKMPWRSEAVTRYLALFKGDVVVIEGLTQFVNSHQVYQWHRANALRALTEIAGTKYAAPICKQWLSDELQEWYPKTVAASILMDVPRQHAFFVECLRREQSSNKHILEKNKILRQQLAYGAFNTARSKSKHKTLFEIVLQPEESTLLRRLAIYLLQQHGCKIEWDDLRPYQTVLGEYSALIETLAISPDVPRPCFILRSVEQLFIVNLTEESLRPFYGNHYHVAAGHLRSAVEYFYTSQHNDFVRNFHQFAHITMVAFHEYVLPGQSNPLTMEYGSLWQHSGFKRLTPTGNKTWELLGELRNRVDHPIDHRTRLYSERIKNSEADNLKRQLIAALQELYQAWITAPAPIVNVAAVVVSTSPASTTI